MNCITTILLTLGILAGAAASAFAQVPTLGGAPAGQAGTPTTGEQVTQVTLLTDHTAIAPGQSLQLGVMFEMADHWHIYWKNPGEAGMAPRIRWHLPEGFTISDLRWPAPIQFDQGGGIIGYGYTNKVMLTATVIAPPAEKFVQSKSVKIEADVDWLVCKNICLPGSKRLSIDLPVGEGKTENEKLFAYWNGKQPEPRAVKVTSVTGIAGKPVTLCLRWDKPVDHVAFFPVVGDDFAVNVDKITNREKSADVTLTVHLMEKVKTDRITITGLVVWQEDGDQRHSAEVEFPVAVAKNEQAPH